VLLLREGKAVVPGRKRRRQGEKILSWIEKKSWAHRRGGRKSIGSRIVLLRARPEVEKRGTYRARCVERLGYSSINAQKAGEALFQGSDIHFSRGNPIGRIEGERHKVRA